jgi:hypothetical protein
MRWYDLDSGFRRNDDMPKLALLRLTPPLQNNEKMKNVQALRVPAAGLGI